MRSRTPTPNTPTVRPGPSAAGLIQPLRQSDIPSGSQKMASAMLALEWWSTSAVAGPGRPLRVRPPVMCPDSCRISAVCQHVTR